MPMTTPTPEQQMRHALNRPDAILEPPILVELETVLANLRKGFHPLRALGLGVMLPQFNGGTLAIVPGARHGRGQRPRIAFT